MTEVRARMDKTFAYLGNRRYVHTTTLTDGMLEAMSDWGFELDRIQTVEAFFRKLMTQSGAYSLLDGHGSRCETGLPVTFKVIHAYERYEVGLKETGVPVSASVPYDEEGLIQRLTIDRGAGSALSDEFQRDGHLLRVMVSLTKRLHHALLPSDGYTRWYVSRYDLDFQVLNASNPQSVRIELQRNIRDMQTRSRVSVGGHDAGFMYFSRKVLEQ